MLWVLARVCHSSCYFFSPISTVRVFFPEYKKLYHCITDLVNSYFVPLFFNVSKCLESNHMDYYASNLIFRVLRYLYRKCSSWNLQILHCLDLHFVDMLCCVMFSFMLSEVKFFLPLSLYYIIVHFIRSTSVPVWTSICACKMCANMWFGASFLLLYCFSSVGKVQMGQIKTSGN